MNSSRNPDFSLIETLRYSPSQGYYFLEEHCQRLANSAGVFDFICTDIQARLLHYAQQLTPSHDYRIRLLLHKNGTIDFQHAQLNSPFQSLKQAQQAPTHGLSLHPDPINTQDILYQHKTTVPHIRAFYDRCLQNKANEAINDIIFSNQNGHCTETTRHNIIIENQGKYYTPPQEDGCLPGIMRAQCLTEISEITIRSITIAELRSATRVYCVNSVHGWIQVKLAP